MGYGPLLPRVYCHQGLGLWKQAQEGEHSRRITSLSLAAEALGPPALEQSHGPWVAQGLAAGHKWSQAAQAASWWGTVSCLPGRWGTCPTFLSRACFSCSLSSLILWTPSLNRHIFNLPFTLRPLCPPVHSFIQPVSPEHLWEAAIMQGLWQFPAPSVGIMLDSLQNTSTQVVSFHSPWYLTWD